VVMRGKQANYTMKVGWGDIATKTIEITVAGCGENYVEMKIFGLMSVDV